MFTKSIQSAEAVNMPVSATRSLAEDIANQSGIIDISEGKTVELWPMPKSTNVRVSNPDTDKSADITAYLFNENVLKNTVTDNIYGDGATGADKPTVTYNDGFGGRLINRLIEGLNMGRGLLCKELTVIGRDADGNQTDDAILSLDAAIQTYNGIRGTAAPANFDLGEAIRVSAFKNGMVTVKLSAWINMVTQVVFSCPKGYTYDFKFKWAV
jgi:hypothetical protein